MYYMPDDRAIGNSYIYNSREEGEDACRSKGLRLCSISAITNWPLCAIGWLTDGRGLWSVGAPGCGFGGYTEGEFFGINGIGGAYCCGKPYYMPDYLNGVASYIYSSREEARAGCQSRGLGLCSREQILGFEFCVYGWLSDTIGFYMNPGHPYGGGEFVYLLSVVSIESFRSDFLVAIQLVVLEVLLRHLLQAGVPTVARFLDSTNLFPFCLYSFHYNGKR